MGHPVHGQTVGAVVYRYPGRLAGGQLQTVADRRRALDGHYDVRTGPLPDLDIQVAGHPPDGEVVDRYLVAVCPVARPLDGGHRGPVDHLGQYGRGDVFRGKAAADHVVARGHHL